MNIIETLSLATQGKKVRRKDWRGDSMFDYITLTKNKDGKFSLPVRRIAYNRETGEEFVCNLLQFSNFSVDDILYMDWELVSDESVSLGV